VVHSALPHQHWNVESDRRLAARGARAWRDLQPGVGSARWLALGSARASVERPPSLWRALRPSAISLPPARGRAPGSALSTPVVPTPPRAEARSNTLAPTDERRRWLRQHLRSVAALSRFSFDCPPRVGLLPPPDQSVRIALPVAARPRSPPSRHRCSDRREDRPPSARRELLAFERVAFRRPRVWSEPPARPAWHGRSVSGSRAESPFWAAPSDRFETPLRQLASSARLAPPLDWPVNPASGAEGSSPGVTHAGGETNPVNDAPPSPHARERESLWPHRGKLESPPRPVLGWPPRSPASRFRRRDL